MFHINFQQTLSLWRAEPLVGLFCWILFRAGMSFVWWPLVLNFGGSRFEQGCPSPFFGHLVIAVMIRRASLLKSIIKRIPVKNEIHRNNPASGSALQSLSLHRRLSKGDHCQVLVLFLKVDRQLKPKIKTSRWALLESARQRYAKHPDCLIAL